jgi:transcriptional regulator with XRE-family HTH domain
VTNENHQLREARLSRGWTQEDAAEQLGYVMLERGVLDPGVDGNMWSRWERGVHQPGPRYLPYLVALFDRSAEELSLGTGNQGLEHLAATTMELVDGVATMGLGEDMVCSVERAAHQLCRAYSTTVPAVLIPQVQARLRQMSQLERKRLTPRQHERFLAAAGWLYLLLAALHCDIGQQQAAAACRDAALYLGQEGNDPDIIGWAWETESWFALFEGRPQDSLAAAEEGLKVAPRLSSAENMNVLKLAQAWARLGNRLEAERALDRAANSIADRAEPEYPDHHFVFDGPKFDFYASTTYAWLHDAKEVERYARKTIRVSGDPLDDPRRAHWHPSRVSIARVDLAYSLFEQGQLEEAVHEAAEAFKPFVRRDALLRAVELDAQLRARYNRTPDVRRFHEQLVLAKRSVQRP